GRAPRRPHEGGAVPDRPAALALAFALMPDSIRVACVQMTSRADKAANLKTAERLVARAAGTGADVVVLPEKWNAIGEADTYRAAAEPLDGGESVDAMGEW